MDEFVTLPSYISLEINAHNLLNLYTLLRDKDRLDLVQHIPKMTSQGCENVFRLFRSQTTHGWTNINFTLMEVCQKAKRVNAIAQTEHFLKDLCKYFSTLLSYEYDKSFSGPLEYFELFCVGQFFWSECFGVNRIFGVNWKFVELIKIFFFCHSNFFGAIKTFFRRSDIFCVVENFFGTIEFFLVN